MYVVTRLYFSNFVSLFMIVNWSHLNDASIVMENAKFIDRQNYRTMLGKFEVIRKRGKRFLVNR